MRAFTVRAIDKFTDWFGSVGCVVETLVFCVALAAAEAWRPQVDPSNLHYLYALTVYSAVTQPALAYAAARAGRAADTVLREIDKQTELLEQLARNETDMLRAILAILDHTADDEPTR